MFNFQLDDLIYHTSDDVASVSRVQLFYLKLNALIYHTFGHVEELHDKKPLAFWKQVGRNVISQNIIVKFNPFDRRN